jgi:hypothetical protein
MIRVGLGHRVRVVNKDATKIKLDGADVVYCYLFPDVIKELDPTLTAARIVISYMHDIPQLPTRRWVVGRHVFYFWENPQRSGPIPK